MKNETKSKEKASEISYNKIMILFLAGCIIGVLMEGTFCLITKGRWESHVVSVVGAFNALYGAGAVLFYIGAIKLKNKTMAQKTVIMAVTATVLELICGLMLRYGLGMRAWNYENRFLNYKGIICIGFTLIWGAVAFVFCKVQPKISEKLEKFESKNWHRFLVVFGIFMTINLCVTAAYITRWSERHYGIKAQTEIESILDRDAPDEWMQSRFIEWEFLDNIQKGKAK